ncbi:MAG: endonuclease/exonuclease/phosphatase family protein [Acidimicrobiia bacterium]
MLLKVADWNLDAWNQAPSARIEYLRRLDCDLVLLQEVRRPMYEAIMESGLFSWGVLSTTLEPRAGHRRWGCAVLGRAPASLVDAERIDAAWFPLPDALALGLPYRTIAARLLIDGRHPLIACSFHARPAAGRHGMGAKKPAFHVGVARWLEHQPGPLVFGIDANTPSQEGLDPGQTRFCWPTTTGSPWGEDQLLGPDVTGRADAYRRYLARNPARAQAHTAARPHGPLAVSHMLAKGPVRYDHLWVTDDIGVERVRYLHRSAVRAGSDHAAIVAVLDVPEAANMAA